ncbi:two-component system, chemotaxis family, response regulator CheB [Desulfocicer vacuolatum DSM 3385]|uniref:Protein-glutamate methylesterase/protein-glutamine glutaminase n=1 Tax=Desulfocicer vacuolatum DSM 3385 TaxID=1121400 RepID=A0A1W2EIL7_9BACT|nr:chemotaxis response regulator protein-glutamate methylesterase [Desulfocicer vacuolatum]SMD09539.1 two-component system, chemotaxis family, response regulator CheB [Desulfocicer vacuolatum DSM 3385]
MNASGELRVLVVDDSVVYRMMVSDVLSGFSNIQVVGTAHNGAAALAKVASLKPDLVTLDIEMPDMDGFEVLSVLAKQFPRVGVIMISGSAGKGGSRTIKALEQGAFDFVVKPEKGDLDGNRVQLEQHLIPILRSFSRMRDIQSILKGKKPLQSQGREKQSTGDNFLTQKSASLENSTSFENSVKSRVVALGVSTGGPVALGKILPLFPGDIGVPIVVVQHMPPVFTRALAESLDKKCEILVREARDGDPLVPGTAYIAPGGFHMKVVTQNQGEKKFLQITDDPPENGCRPSVDYLFRSVAAHFGACATGVIMTGMGYDGAQGVKQMSEQGARIIAQDEKTSAVFGMAKRPIEWGIVDAVVPLEKLAVEILKTVGMGKKRAASSNAAGGDETSPRKL